METLDIAALDNLVQIFGAQVQGSLHKLRVMRLNNCDKLLNVAVSDSIRLLPNLAELEVKFCSSLEAVFDFEVLRVSEEDAQAMLCQLETLKLSNLSVLSDICKKVPKETRCFQNLRSLHINCCNSLRYLLSHSLAKLLLNLQNIRLKGCEMIEEIITGEEGSSETCVVSGIVFPQLRILELEDLNNLRLFCASAHNFEFPLLDKVLIRNCPSMNTFCSGLVSAPKLDQLNAGNDQRVRMDNLNNAIHRMKEKEIERSEFKEKGILNMSEFIDAGDHLVARSHNWSWESERRHFLIARSVFCLKRAESVEAKSKTTAILGSDSNDPLIGSESPNESRVEWYEAHDDNIAGPRTYDVTITYDRDEGTPRLWLKGYDASGWLLDPEDMLEDVIEDKGQAQVTTKTHHPHFDGKHLSICPMLQGDPMKKIIHDLVSSAEIHKYLCLLLESMAPIIPTIETVQLL
ncbi:hypothetical protein RJ640_002180 [Escallonia rubra]|uniref:Disease resistance protein At4g27190-like leucine-rich repeats domain-containing protein n=1 Tax=Escallonia rubra TaxID=112253 RepID=A0AA88QAG1_9ASTE|nr:hypothetical protein RJ640_002180 [Escallonia rubra]